MVTISGVSVYEIIIKWAVVDFCRVVRPLDTEAFPLVPKERDGGDHEREKSPLSEVGGGVGGLPREYF